MTWWSERGEGKEGSRHRRRCGWDRGVSGSRRSLGRGRSLGMARDDKQRERGVSNIAAVAKTVNGRKGAALLQTPPSSHPTFSSCHPERSRGIPLLRYACWPAHRFRRRSHRLPWRSRWCGRDGSRSCVGMLGTRFPLAGDPSARGLARDDKKVNLRDSSYRFSLARALSRQHPPPRLRRPRFNPAPPLQRLPRTIASTRRARRRAGGNPRRWDARRWTGVRSPPRCGRSPSPSSRESRARDRR